MILTAVGRNIIIQLQFKTSNNLKIIKIALSKALQKSNNSKKCLTFISNIGFGLRIMERYAE
jgi:hypothetical protein